MSEELRAAILQVTDWQAMSAAELLTAITEIRRSSKTDPRYNIQDIAREFSMTEGEAIFAALSAVAPGMSQAFTGQGIDASNPQWLAMADQLIAGPLSGLDSETQQALKYVGFDSAKLYDQPVTESEVATAKQAIIDDNRLINAKALFSDRMTVGGDAAAVWSQAWTDAGA